MTIRSIEERLEWWESEKERKKESRQRKKEKGDIR